MVQPTITSNKGAAFSMSHAYVSHISLIALPVILQIHNRNHHAPMYHNSTPKMLNFVPSSLSGSLPNVGQVFETPLSRLSSSQRP